MVSASSAPATREIPLLSYRIVVGRGALQRLHDVASTAGPFHRYALISDENVLPRYAPMIERAFGDSIRSFAFPAGEAHKTRDTWSRLTDQMLEAGLGRDTCVIALGGGVVGDVAGFVAATYLRGVPVVQVPTSLLAMIDASIGGKTGVDTPAGKNLIGAFHQPIAVVADPQALSTLPRKHLRAGLAEAIKHGVIADAAYFDAISSELRTGELEGTASWLPDVVARGIEIKASVVAADERELGIRKVLNFGHTIGHAIEMLSDYRVLHGEAIAIGMCIEADIAERLGVAEIGTRDAIGDVVRRVGLPATRPKEMRAADLLRATRADKKTRAGRVEYALPARIGKMAGGANGWSMHVPDDIVEQSLNASHA